jgi:hypothetical protein
MAKNTPSTRVIGCRLPAGLIIEHPADPAKTVLLNGANRERIIGSGYGKTDVDAELWAAWKAAHPKFPAVLSGAIFEAPDDVSVDTAAQEVAAEKTGFEQMPQNAQGVKPADKD